MYVCDGRYGHSLLPCMPTKYFCYVVDITLIGYVHAHPLGGGERCKGKSPSSLECSLEITRSVVSYVVTAEDRT